MTLTATVKVSGSAPLAATKKAATATLQIATLPVGSHRIVAQYTGSAVHAASTSPIVTHAVR